MDPEESATEKAYREFREAADEFGAAVLDVVGNSPFGRAADWLTDRLAALLNRRSR